MQDFFYMSDVKLGSIAGNLIDRDTVWSLLREKEEDLMSSPDKMYMLSLINRERLPENLHKAMLLWSFDPNFGPTVQMYLDWSNHCEDMRTARIRFEKRMLIHDRVMFGLMILTGTVLAFIIGMDLLK